MSKCQKVERSAFGCWLLAFSCWLLAFSFFAHNRCSEQVSPSDKYTNIHSNQFKKVLGLLGYGVKELYPVIFVMKKTLK